MFRKVVRKPPVEIFVHISEGVSLLRKDEHIEAFVGADEGLDDTHGVSRMYIVIDITVDKEKMSLEVSGDFRISGDLIDESGVTLVGNDLLHTMVSLTPPTVIDVIVVVSGTRHSYLEEIRILADCGSTHESSAGVSVDSHLVNMNDGEFEVILVKMPQSLADLQRIIHSITTSDFDNPMFEFFKTKEIQFDFEKEIPWSLDGEYCNGGERVRIQNVKDGIVIVK